MVIALTITGANEVANKLRALGTQMPDAVGRALKRFAEAEIATPAKQQYVPVVTGNLRASIVVGDPIVTARTVTVIIGAGGAAAPYGRMVHENPRSGQTQGISPRGVRYTRWSRVGQWKYLEIPAIEAANTRLDAFARECGVELQEVISGLR